MNRSPVDRSHSPQGWKNWRPDLEDRDGELGLGNAGSQGVLLRACLCACCLHCPHAPTMPSTGPTAEPPTAVPGRPQRADGCVHPHSSPSRDSGDHSGEHSGGTHDSAGHAGAAVGTEGSLGSALPTLVGPPFGERAEDHSQVLNLGGIPEREAGLKCQGTKARSLNLARFFPQEYVCITYRHQAVSAAPKWDSLRNHGSLFLL